jgi:hypothetical protein
VLNSLLLSKVPPRATWYSPLVHGAAALSFEVEAHGFEKSTCTGERPSITDLGEDCGSGVVADDWGKRGGERRGGKLCDLGLGGSEGAVNAIGVVADGHQNVAFKAHRGDTAGGAGRGNVGSNLSSGIGL